MSFPLGLYEIEHTYYSLNSFALFSILHLLYLEVTTE